MAVSQTEGGAPTWKGALKYYLANFFRKMYKNEEMRWMKVKNVYLWTKYFEVLWWEIIIYSRTYQSNPEVKNTVSGNKRTREFGRTTPVKWFSQSESLNASVSQSVASTTFKLCQKFQDFYFYNCVTLKISLALKPLVTQVMFEASCWRTSSRMCSWLWWSLFSKFPHVDWCRPFSGTSAHPLYVLYFGLLIQFIRLSHFNAISKWPKI